MPPLQSYFTLKKMSKHNLELREILAYPAYDYTVYEKVFI